MNRVRMTVDGVVVEAEPGTTVAAALLDAGVSRFRTSVTGQARGPLCAMGICHECRVVLDGQMHRRACLEGSAAGRSVQTTGTSFDLGPQAPVERVTTQVAVVGAGPAGIAAACRAAESGAEVLLLDEGLVAGGQIWRHLDSHQLPASAREWLGRLARSGARVAPRSTVVDGGLGRGSHRLVVTEGPRLREVSAERIIVATGARELFLPFPGWTLPNVMGVGAAQALLKSGASFRKRNVVVAGSGPLVLPVAALLAADGARLRLVAEQAARAAVLRFGASLWRQPRKLVEAARFRVAFSGSPYRTGVWVVAARGDRQVQEVDLTDGRRTWTEPCDLLCCAFGLLPNLELPLLLGCEIAENGVSVDGRQATSVAGVFAAGESTGVGGAESALLEGQIAGLAAAGRDAAAAKLTGRRDEGRAFGRRLATAFAPRAALRALATAETIVCRCEDVTLARLDAGWSRRQAKLYTRVGMGPCQGRVCGPGLELLFGWDRDSVRPPLSPTSLGMLAESIPFETETVAPSFEVKSP